MIKEEPIIVPGDIRYISEWREKYGYAFPDYPCIINKQITGCGFTEECIRNNECVVLCSPRKILLDNKSQQHPYEVYYAKNEYESILDIDKDLNTSPKNKVVDTTTKDKAKESHIAMIDGIRNYVSQCMISNKPAKILVTYDSFRIVKEALLGISQKVFDKFRVVIDEFQSIFTDSRFKSGTELELLHHLEGVQKLTYVSATPMIDKYLDMMPQFATLPYIEYDWYTDNPNRIIKPDFKVRSLINTSLQMVAYQEISRYLRGDYEKIVVCSDDGSLFEVESKELIIYVNSVKNITDIIRKAELKPEQVNILCSDTLENQKKIDTSLRRLKNGKYPIGTVPLIDEPRKMFTICTRTVYLGADFYSDNARTLVLSDANIECLAVDITLDLPQILGRQRLECNPWKNRAELHLRLLSAGNRITQGEFDNYINKKLDKSGQLLALYDDNTNVSIETKIAHAEKLLNDIAFSMYKNDYVAVNTHTKGELEPTLNKLVMISEQRAFEIQQLDYADRFNIFAALDRNGITVDKETSDFLYNFDLLTQFPNRMKLVCDAGLSGKFNMDYIFRQIPGEFGNYYRILGPDKIKACSYVKAYLEKAYNRIMFNTDQMAIDIYAAFNEGDRLTTQEIAERLEPIYERYNNPNRPKGSDIKEYFETSSTKKTITQPDGTKKVKDGFKLIKRIR